MHGIIAHEINTSCYEEGVCTELDILVMVIDVVTLHSSEITHLGIHEMKPDENMRQVEGKKLNGASVRIMADVVANVAQR